MKRSEMIKYIKDEFIEFAEIYNTTTNNRKHLILNQYIKILLNKIEDLGMLPPMLPLHEVTQRLIEDGEWATLNEWEEE